MPIHSALDVLLFGLGALLAGRRFRDGTESPSLFQLIEGGRVILPYGWKGAGLHDVVAHTPSGPLQLGVRTVAGDPEPEAFIIYHHGLGEIPFDYGFSRLLLPPPPGTALFALRAAHHGSRKGPAGAMASLESFATTLAASALLVQAIIEGLGPGKPVAVAGTSIGGFLANAHQVRYGTAGAYVPIMAGLATDHIITGTIYGRGFVPLDGAAKSRIASALNMEDRADALDPDRTFPILARRDRIVEYERQRASYGGLSVETMEKGHITGAVAYGRLRRQILGALDAARRA